MQIMKYLSAILTTNANHTVEINAWRTASETKHLHFELDLIIISVVENINGGISGTSTLK